MSKGAFRCGNPIVSIVRISYTCQPEQRWDRYTFHVRRFGRLASLSHLVTVGVVGHEVALIWLVAVGTFQSIYIGFLSVGFGRFSLREALSVWLRQWASIARYPQRRSQPVFPGASGFISDECSAGSNWP